tara:strand:- start:3529 stop:4008 length:480 start_codon:yes stop_codon:yes gene_type:complete
MKNIRIGYGYDMHKLTSGTYIILGGIKIDSDYSIIAHSDGDILLHTLSDAIYGSLAKGDIGTHFPSDKKNLNISSLEIIQHACGLLKDSNYEINNTDITILLENPFLQPFIDEMRQSLSKILSIDKSKISIKSSTSQKIGLVGENKAIICYATILISNE